MKRAVITIAATVAGTAGVLAYNPAVHALGTTSGATTSGGATSGAAGGTSGGQASGSQSGSGPSAGSGSSSGASNSSGAVTGQAVQIPFGTVQVQITMQNGKITDVQALQLPSDQRRSADIGQYAAPQLRSEVLSAQSAQVDTISGATYTSMGYLQSLQSALDQVPA